MARRDQHLAIDRRHLGKELNHVHEHLDHMHKVHGGRHRYVLHHEEEVERIRERWGDEAALSAQYHIMADIGYIPTKAQWEQVTSHTRDYMGRSVKYLELFDNCDDVAISIAYHDIRHCQRCQKNTIQRLIEVDVGRFFCSKCKAGNLFPDYRMEIRHGQCYADERSSL